MAKRKKSRTSVSPNIKWGNPPKNTSFIPLFILVLSGAIYYNLSRITTTTPQISVLEESPCTTSLDQDSCENQDFCAWVNDNAGERCVALEY